MTLAFVAKYPDLVEQVLLQNLTGGQKAAEKLSKSYFDSVVSIAKEGGMEAVAKLDPYYSKLLSRGLPSLQQRRWTQVVQTSLENEFLPAMKRSREFLWRAIDPVLGFSEKMLSEIANGSISFILVYSRSSCDGMHTRGVMQALSKALGGDIPILDNPKGRIWVPKAVQFFASGSSFAEKKMIANIPKNVEKEKQMNKINVNCTLATVASNFGDFRDETSKTKSKDKLDLRESEKCRAPCCQSTCD